MFSSLRYLLMVVALLVSPARAAADAPNTILVLGDSLSAAHNIPMEAGWVNLLRQRLAESGEQYVVVNASVSGETTDGGLARLPALLERHHPSIVIVELGANDALRGFAPSDIEANLEGIIELAREANAKVGLLGIEIPINYGRRYRQAFVAVYDRLATSWDLPLLPFLLDGVALDASLMQRDGLHPTAQAQPRILDNVWPIFRQLAAEPHARGFTPSQRTREYGN